MPQPPRLIWRGLIVCRWRLYRVPAPRRIRRQDGARQLGEKGAAPSWQMMMGRGGTNVRTQQE